MNNTAKADTNTKIACILDPFTFTCLKYECHLVQLDMESWQSTLAVKKPDVLFVESAWSDTFKKLTSKAVPVNGPLESIIHWCKEHQIPTVFWNKEDPLHFNHFIEIAKLFDYIFTTDVHSIPNYKTLTGNKNVFLLPFAAQPKIHNPIGRDKEKASNIGFAGTWYRLRPERISEMEMLFNPSIKYGLHIYDRMYHFTLNANYKFPEIYQPYIQGYLPYEDMVDAYKKYHVFLNVNTVKTSPTMLSRRVIELLACGINVVSNYSLAIERMFPGLVLLSRNEQETGKHLETLLGQKELRDRIALLGQREVFLKHTYRDRIHTVLKKIGISKKQEAPPKVSIITCTNRPELMLNVFTNFILQNYKNLELIVVINKNCMLAEPWLEKAKNYKNKCIRVLKLDESATLGECLNFGIAHARSDYISFFDDDDCYGASFILDLVNAFQYAEAGIIGKCSYYSYLKDFRLLTVYTPGNEYRYVDTVAGSAMVVKKEIFDKVAFRPTSENLFTYFFEDCKKSNVPIYSSDRFNYICMRRRPLKNHTWKVSHEDFLKDSEVVVCTDNYKKHVYV